MARKPPPTAVVVVPDDWRTIHTVSVPVAGAILGLSIDASYRAVRENQIPVIRFGRKIVVPTVQIRRMLGEIPEGAVAS